MAITYTETFDSFVPADVGWQDYDIFTNNGIPKGAVAEILMINTDTAAEQLLGVRTDNSALNRYLYVHESEGGGGNGYCALVTVDSSTGKIDTYCDDDTEATFYILAYWQGITFTEAIDQMEANAQASWSEEDMSGLGVPANAVCQIAMVQTAAGWYADMGVRSTSSALSRLVRVHECEPTDDDNCIYTNYVKADGDSKVDLYSQYTSSPDRWHYLLGWFGSDMDYQELWTLKDNDEDGDWDEFDLSADLDQDGRVVNVCTFNTETASTNTLGVRGGDSALNRYYSEHEAESYGITGSCFTAQSDSNGVIDLYASGGETTYLGGYFKFSAAAGANVPQKMHHYNRIKTKIQG